MTSQAQDWDEIGRQGFLSPPPPNPSSPDLTNFDDYQPRGPEFWPGLVVGLASRLAYSMTRKSLPYKPVMDSASPGTDLPASDQLAYFDNTFLLGLRSFAWPQQEQFNDTSAASGQAATYGVPARQQLARIPRPWVWKNRVTAWPQAPQIHPEY
jgi:hypothetical protein